MKVAFRLSSMGFGGAERVFLSVAEVLARNFKVEVHFVVDMVGKGETENLVKTRGFKLIGLDCSRTLQSIIPLKTYINNEQPDILISAYTDTNFAALISAKLAKNTCKVIVSEHASLKEHWQHASLKKRLVLNAYVKFGYKLADYILTVSEGIKSQIIAMGHSKNKVGCIHNPVRFNSASVDKVTLKNKNASPTILAVGRIAKQKDYSTLLRAFNLINKNNNPRLVIVGGVHEPAEKQKLEHFIQANNLAELVDFVGFTENIQDYYAMADIFVLSSAWEGFGNVIVEALAFGLPVVSTNCNHGPAEILQAGKFGILVDVGDREKMAEAINQILENNHFDPKNQVARAKDFDESTIGEAYYQLFKKVMVLP